ncbi:MAG: hypothetical protein Q4G30_05390 [Actinomycetaceae bacterium]|nr:hypothetical protein [Actinomycetaceae bacterium]
MTENQSAQAPTPQAAKRTKNKTAPTPRPSLPARAFGVLLVCASLVIVPYLVWDIVSTAQDKASAARIPEVTSVSPLETAWTSDVPAPLVDPRKLQSWHIAQIGRELLLLEGTDGSKETAVLMQIDPSTGHVDWSRPLDGLKPANCLPQLWQGYGVCTDTASRSLVLLGGEAQVQTHVIEQWDHALGDQVITGIFDQFLLIPIAAAREGSQGMEVIFMNPDFSTRSGYPLFVPGAQATQPLTAQAHGAQLLAGVHTSTGETHTYTWGYSISFNQRTGLLDTSTLGAMPQASLLESGFIASADPFEEHADDGEDATPAELPWRIYDDFGRVTAEGQAPVNVLHLLHEQLRAGRYLDAATAQGYLDAKHIPFIVNDGLVLTTTDMASCRSFNECVSTTWLGPTGASITLQAPARPIIEKSGSIVFLAEGGLYAYGAAQGEALWDGIVPPLEGAGSRRDPQAIGSELWVASLMGEAKKDGRAVLTAYRMP